MPYTLLRVYASVYRSHPWGLNPAFRTDKEASDYARDMGCTVEWGLHARFPNGRIRLLSWHHTRDDAEIEADRIVEEQSLPDGLTAADLIGGNS